MRRIHCEGSSVEEKKEVEMNADYKQNKITRGKDAKRKEQGDKAGENEASKRDRGEGKREQGEEGRLTGDGRSWRSTRRRR